MREGATIGFLTKELLPLRMTQVSAGNLLGLLDEIVQIDLPHLRRAIAASRDEPTVFCEAQRKNRALMSREDDGLVGGVLQVPRPRRAVVAARDETPVRRKGEGVNRAIVSPEDEGLGGGVLQVPHPRRAITTDRDETPVGREG